MYSLSRILIDSLVNNNVTYCHWKSNLLLNEALAGYDDLDLLVKQEDIEKFEFLIISLGFIEGSNKHISFSSIKHFYGYDQDSGNILHLHVYYKIKTGPSWTKPIRFNFEEYFLNNLIVHESGMLVPQKHIELVIFIFRVMLKYSKVNEFILINKEQERTIKEIDYLKLDMNEKKLDNFLDIYFKNISKKELFDYISIIKNGSISQKYIQGNMLKNKLSNYKDLNFIQENINNITQFTYRVVNKLFLKQKKKIHNSGKLIVVAGLDATGKTTITTELKEWLGKNFTVSLIHFGKPPSTLATYPINILIKFLRSRLKSSSLKSSIKNDKSPKSFLYVIRQLVLAYDRYRLMKKYHNKVLAGEIVLCDRYKSEDVGVMDSKRLNAKIYTGIKKTLAEVENKLYLNMPEPEMLFYLNVPVEVAVLRNEQRIKDGKESEEFIRIRHEQNKDLTYKSKLNYLISTNQEYRYVIEDVKSKIWEAL